MQLGEALYCHQKCLRLLCWYKQVVRRPPPAIPHLEAEEIRFDLGSSTFHSFAFIADGQGRSRASALSVAENLPFSS
jgi:hypothetical protein